MGEAGLINRGLENLRDTLESDKKCCSRRRERCTYIAIRKALVKASCSSCDAAPFRRNVPPTTRMLVSSEDSVFTRMQ